MPVGGGFAARSPMKSGYTSVAALLLLAGHIVLLASVRPASRAIFLSDLLLFAVSLLTTFACYSASRRSRRFARPFWFVIGSAFALWSVAQCVQLYLDMAARWSTISVIFLYFMSMTVMFIAVFPADEEPGAGGVHWPWILDGVQLLVLLVALYLYLIYVPELMYGADRVGLLRLQLLHWRNVALVVGLIVRAVWARTPSERHLFAPMAFTIALYTVGTWFANHFDFWTNAASSTWYSLTWTLPFTLVTLQAANWSDPGDVQGRSMRPGSLASTLVIYLPSLGIPVLIMVQYDSVVREQVILGLGSLMVSIICYSLRLALLHRQQQRTLVELAASEERHRSLFDSNVVAVWRSTIDGRMIDCNRRFCELFGYTREELLAQPSWMLYPGGKPERDITIAKRNAVNLPGVFEQRYVRKDGSPMWGLTSATVSHGADGTTYTEGTILDITERRNLEEQLRLAQRMEAVGLLAGGIAHDFNNILTVISGYAEMILERSADGSEDRDDAKEIQAGAEHATSLTHQLLAFSRQQVLKPEVLNLNLILENLTRMMRRLIGEDIEMETHADANLGAVKADPGQIEQIVLNIVVNARDAMPSGGKLTVVTANVDLDESYSATHAYTAPGPYVLLEISDNGTGMDEATSLHIFEPFYTTKKKGKGTGLGLSTVYGIVKQSGGHIEVDSQLGKGTTFKIYLPRIEQPVTHVSSSRPHETCVQGGHETILLVEDDPALRDLARRILTSRNYSVLAPDRPEDVETLCDKHAGQIDLLLTDVVMPSLSGAEVARRVSHKRPGIKVLYMSGYTTDAIVHHGILDEGISFLSKPFTASSLSAKVREVLDGTRQ